jgi:hypothetical protein
MSHRDWFVRRLSQELPLNESLIDKIVKHQFESVIRATHTNKTIEISGFGKLMWSDNSANRLLDRLEGQIKGYRNKIANSSSQHLIQKWTDIIDELLIKRQVLINRMNELESNLRGVEEQASPEGGSQGDDFTGSEIEDGDL